jgi:hypothetical protein
MSTRPLIGITLGVLAMIAMAATLRAQISMSFEDAQADSVLNAPYRGTVNSLREASLDLPYGEVRTWIEMQSDTLAVENWEEMKIWHLADEGLGTLPWDRSVLRLYFGVDASGNQYGHEIDLTDCTGEGSAISYWPDAEDEYGNPTWDPEQTQRF